MISGVIPIMRRWTVGPYLIRRISLRAAVALVLIGPSLGFVTDLEAQSSDRPHADRILVIARGDDFGFTNSANVAMAEAFEHGIMRSASILVTAPWAAEAAKLARANPDWTVGVHLTLTSNWDLVRWGPAASARDVPSLIAPDGNLYAGGYFWTPPPVAELPEYDRSLWAVEPPDVAEAELEARAQIERARALGLRIDHIDCHEGMLCNPPLFPIMQQLSRELCVPIGTMRQLGESGYGPRFRDATTSESVKAQILSWLESIGPGIWNTVTHPIVDGPEVRAISDWEVGLTPFLIQSLATHQAWMSPEVAEVISRRGIELVSYRDLWDYHACEPRPLDQIPRR